jgi:hypothetical protein
VAVPQTTVDSSHHVARGSAEAPGGGFDSSNHRLGPLVDPQSLVAVLGRMPRASRSRQDTVLEVRTLTLPVPQRVAVTSSFSDRLYGSTLISLRRREDGEGRLLLPSQVSASLRSVASRSSRPCGNDRLKPRVVVRSLQVEMIQIRQER